MGEAVTGLKGISKARLRRVRELVDAIEGASPAWLARGLDHLGRRPFNSYSFYGEDALINGYLRRAEFEGRHFNNYSYVDIGAWRPIQGSNTYWLYRRGFRGTLVEPNANMSKLLKSARPGDQVLTQACACSATVEFYSFGSYAESNTTSARFAEDVTSMQGHKVEQVSVVPALSLNEILDLHQKRFGGLFLLNVDAEGKSEEILISTDWSAAAVRPKIIISEVDGVHSPNALLLDHGNLKQFLVESRYELLSICGVSLIFVDTEGVNGKGTAT